MTEGGDVSVFERDYFGGDGTPFDEWHARTLTWGFLEAGDESVIDRETLKADLGEGGKLRALLERVHAGHSTVWDGSNYVGELNADASEASEEIETMLADYDVDRSAPDRWDSYEWLTAGGSSSLESCLADLGLTVDATPEQIADAAEKSRKMALGDGIEIASADDAIREIIADVRRERARNADED